MAAKTTAIKAKELKPEELKWSCDPDVFEFDSTEQIEPIEGILGQERALKAIKLGMELRSPGYNIYIAGLSGTGKATTVKQILEAISTKCPPLCDYTYVNNFKDEDRPLLLTFQTGQARFFRDELYAAIDVLKKRIPAVLEGEQHLSKRKKIINLYNDREQNLLTQFNEKLKKENLTLAQIKVGDIARPEIFALINGKAVPITLLDEHIKAGTITKDESDILVKKYGEYQHDLQLLFRKGLKVSQEFQEKLNKLEQETVDLVVKGVMENLRENYTDAKVIEYLKHVEENIMENIQVFKGIKPEDTITLMVL